MNIGSQLRNLFASYSPHAPQPGTQDSAPNVPRAQQGSQINFGSDNSPAPNSAFSAANAGNTNPASPEAWDLISSFMSKLAAILSGSDQNKAQPQAQTSNANNPGSSPNAINYDNSAKRASGAGQSNAQQGGQASYGGQAGDVPKKRGPYSETELVDGFRQEGGTENCVTVGAIKAAMQKEGGPKEVYESVEESGDGFDVKMKDSDKIYHVSKAELDEAAQKSGFKGDNKEMLKDANFMYAVSAKREQEENGGSFGDALGALNHSQPAINGFKRLGLQNHVEQATARELANGAAGVIAQNDHVAAVLNGKVEDYGTLGRTPDAGVFALKLV
ncbi:hypothetical protein ACWHY4_11285 [Pseudomonas sp. E2-15]